MIRRALFLVSTLWLVALELGMRAHTLDGVHYQQWSSDVMMQTLPIEVLRAAPLQALFYLHIQPPMLDSVRAALAALFPGADSAELVRRVDVCFTAFYAVLFGILSAGVYEWTRRLAGRRVAILTWLVWIAYPAPIFYATLLEGTFMSAFFIFFFFYELWRVQKQDGSIYRLALLTLCVFLTRTIFQWYFFPIVMVLLLLQQVAPRYIAIFALLCATIALPYLAKQKLLFGTLSTTTYAGYFQAGMFWYQPTPDELRTEANALEYRYPQKAVRYQGAKPYNSEQTAIDNLTYGPLTYRHCREHCSACLQALSTSLGQNIRNYWQPSAAFRPNGLTDHLFWTPSFNWLFSGLRYQMILAAGTGAWALASFRRWAAMRTAQRGASRKDMGRALSLGAVAALAFGTTLLANRGAWIEADRLKFLLEPLFFVFVAASLHRLLGPPEARR